MIESFEWIGVSGIVLEILGFIFLLMYYGKPFPADEYDKWKKEKNVKDEDETDSNKFVKKTFTFQKEPGGNITAWTNWPIHKIFWYKWLIKTKGPMIMIIVGLVFQAIQLWLD